VLDKCDGPRASNVVIISPVLLAPENSMSCMFTFSFAYIFRSLIKAISLVNEKLIKTVNKKVTH